MRCEVEKLLASYPRTRPALSPAWRERYHHTHLDSREGRTPLYRLTQMLESWMHRRAATQRAAVEQVLEIGAGTLNHLRWEPPTLIYDVVEPYHQLYAGRPEAARVRNFYADLADVPAENRYQRIISIAALEHVLDLPRLVALAALRLAPQGAFRVGIPAEGGLLWGVAWRLSVGLSCRLRTGLDYGQLMRYEHVSQAGEVIQVLEHFFHDCQVRRFPLPWQHLSLYASVRCRFPRLDRCQAALA